MEYRFQTCNDYDWNNLYGSGYANSYNAPIKRAPIGSGKRGFLNTYAETFPHEERAEIFAALMLEPDTVITHIKKNKDRILKSKTRYVIKKCENLIDFHIQVTTPEGVWY